MAGTALSPVSRRRKVFSQIDVVDGVARIIQLTRGYEALVDIADIPLVEGRCWYVMRTPTGHLYARTGSGPKGYILMHRLLTGALLGEQVDHRDGNGLNNCRDNIRNASASQNQANKGAEARNLLGIKGVEARGAFFRAAITHKGRKIRLGNFATAAEASAAYIEAAQVLWGEFAKR